MKYLKSLVFVLLSLIAFSALAQASQPPVRWRAFVKVDEKGCGTLTVKALVAEGWHLYALEMPPGGPKATSFDLAGSHGIELKGSLTPVRPASESFDALFGMKLAWWDSNIEFTVPFKIISPDARFKCTVSYMACDGTTCRPPSTETLTGAVKPKVKQ